MTQTCATCRYYLFDKTPANTNQLGLCRRYPATWTTKDRGFEFPVMRPIGWCGEHEEQKSHQA